MKPLWEQGREADKRILDFTVGNDRGMDQRLITYDIIGSVAHAKMLGSAGLIKHDESALLVAELTGLYKLALQGKITIEPDAEDIHSQIEFMLTGSLGETGKRIHTGRSRNDQVLLDIRLFLRDEIREMALMIQQLFRTLLALADRNRFFYMPGYTHMQVAMPSSFGLWFSAFAESLTDDITMLEAAYRVVNQNPLGSGAGYGSGFPVDRMQTTRLLGFDELNVNSVYAQMTRGKVERTLAFALSSLAATLSKLAGDVCLYSGQNFRFFSFPDHLVTGSSIMPHKKNPDVFEIVRGRCNQLQSLPNEITIITTNLPTGYHRDLQILKESLFPAISMARECLGIVNFMLENITVREDIVEEKIYDYMFSVEEVALKVQNGLSFREAYKQVAESINTDRFVPGRKLHHTHTGSIGNLALEIIDHKMQNRMKKFNFNKPIKAIKRLMKDER